MNGGSESVMESRDISPKITLSSFKVQSLGIVSQNSQKWNLTIMRGS